MGSRAEVLDRTKELLIASRDLTANPSNPFDAVSGTPAMDNLTLNGAVITEADLTKLLGEIEKAKTDEEMWKKVAGTIGSLIGGLAKGLIVLTLIFALVGCSTPPSVKQASQIERQAVVAFKADHDAIVKALFSDLALALETQIRLIEDYEIKAKGATVNQVDLMTLLAQARKKREEIAQKLDTHVAKVKEADANFTIFLRIHDAIDAFLQRKTFGAEDLEQLFTQIIPLWNTVKPP
jgi:hypothetical protein